MKGEKEMIKYFRHTLWHKIEDKSKTEEEINNYAKNHKLKIVSISADDSGVWVAFECIS